MYASLSRNKNQTSEIQNKRGKKLTEFQGITVIMIQTYRAKTCKLKPKVRESFVAEMTLCDYNLLKRAGERGSSFTRGSLWGA